MNSNFWLSLTGFFSLLFFANPGHTLLLLEVKQVGSDVVISGNGSANISALLSEGTNTDFTNVLSDVQIYTGPAAFGDTNGAGGDVSLWSSITGPAVFGADASVLANPDTGTGDLFGILASFATPAPQLILPLGYVSGTPLTGSSTFFNQNLSSLGFTPGSSFTWSWGNGVAADSLVLEVPLSSTAVVPGPLPIAGAALALAQSRRLRRRTKAGGRLIAK